MGHAVARGDGVADGLGRVDDRDELEAVVLLEERVRVGGLPDEAGADRATRRRPPRARAWCSASKRPPTSRGGAEGPALRQPHVGTFRLIGDGRTAESFGQRIGRAESSNKVTSRSRPLCSRPPPPMPERHRATPQRRPPFPHRGGHVGHADRRRLPRADRVPSVRHPVIASIDVLWLGAAAMAAACAAATIVGPTTSGALRPPTRFVDDRRVFSRCRRGARHARDERHDQQRRCARLPRQRSDPGQRAAVGPQAWCSSSRHWRTRRSGQPPSHGSVLSRPRTAAPC